jgi:diguanylate cyclase (GGDEF)-like protein
MYRTQLVGFDDVPSRWKLISIMEYRNLPPGEYVFRVWGRDYAGNVSGPAEFPFEIAPAPWQTWWARGFVLLLAMLLVWGGVHLRMRAVRARERRLASLVEQRTRELAEANARLEELVREDPLTGLANRRAFDEALGSEWSRSRRTGEPLSLILVDIDGFKDWNDSQGHPAGDVYLKHLGEILTRVAQRTTDLPARIGGDEFAILLPQTSLAWASALAEEIRNGMEDTAEKRSQGRDVSWPTISCGVAASHGDMTGHQELLELADRCLYAAKRAGGNCVVSQNELEDGWLG